MSGPDVLGWPTEPRERPILFSGAMINAILDGSKTQTRRVVKAPKWSKAFLAGVDYGCPYGHVDDRLWVREAFRHVWTVHDCESGKTTCRLDYRADRACLDKPWTDEAPPPVQKWWNTGRYPWTPPIHMPRWASRITLEILNVGVERVQEISEADAIAEGLRDDGGAWSVPRSDGGCFRCVDPRHTFEQLWDSINAERGFSWANNPWVWVISFRRLEPNGGDA